MVRSSLSKYKICYLVNIKMHTTDAINRIDFRNCPILIFGPVGAPSLKLGTPKPSINAPSVNGTSKFGVTYLFSFGSSGLTKHFVSLVVDRSVNKINVKLIYI